MSELHWKRTLGLLMAVWGLVAMQRFAPGFLAPFIIEDFQLSNTQWGLVMGSFAFAWAGGSFLSGLMTDRIGVRKMILLPGFIAALFGWASGVVVAFWQFVTVRLLLGLSEGAVWPPLAKAATQVAPPDRKGIAVSLLSASFLVLGMAVGAPLITQLGEQMGWRWGFFLIAIPLIIALLLLRKFMAADQVPAAPSSERATWRVLANRNVAICAAISASQMARVYLIMSFGILYMTQVHGMPVADSGIILGIALIGDIIGAVVMGRFADKTGYRRGIVIASAGLSVGAGIAFALLPVGTPVWLLLASLFVFILCAGGIGPLAVVLIPTESVEEGQAAAAIGTTNSIGELLGGGLFPIIGGVVADAIGLPYAMLLAAGMMGLTFFLGFAIRPVQASS